MPYWLFPREGGATIERHVPALPLSRDVQRLEALRQQLVVYRMVFGQPRQDDLMSYLMSRFAYDEIAHLLKLLQIDLAPPRP
ncbi:MAG TPA: hypothetical protein VMT85_21585 [Thermoanaerobaculia bacterium]|nr:hypothetical protein [Thermoanaerobaculia bacterium]